MPARAGWHGCRRVGSEPRCRVLGGACRCGISGDERRRLPPRHQLRPMIDPSRIVITGHSAGGHLSLTTGMLPVSAGLDRRCPGNDELKVAAILNWMGITDVLDLQSSLWCRSLQDCRRGSIRDSIAHLVGERGLIAAIRSFSIRGDSVSAKLSRRREVLPYPRPLLRK